MKTLAQKLARTLTARNNCVESGNKEWQDIHELKLDMLMDKLPSGSGIDSGNQLDLDCSACDKLVINSSYHCMNSFGSYDGWVDYKVTVTPSLQHGIYINIAGYFSLNKNAYGLKEYLHEKYDSALNCAV